MLAARLVISPPICVGMCRLFGSCRPGLSGLCSESALPVVSQVTVMGTPGADGMPPPVPPCPPWLLYHHPCADGADGVSDVMTTFDRGSPRQVPAADEAAGPRREW